MKGLLITYGLTYGGALAALINPWIGVLGYFIFCILRPDAIWFWSVPAGNYSRTLALAALTGWAARGFGNWRLGRATVIVWSLLVFLGWSIVCAAQARDQARAWDCIDVLAKIVIPCVVATTLIDSLERLKTLVWSIVLTQGYVALELNQYYFRGYNMALEGFGGMGRAVLGLSLVLSLMLGIFLCLTAERRWQSLLALGCNLLIVHAVLLTFSRGALLSMIASAVVAFYLLPKRPTYIAAAALFLAIGLAMAGKSVRERFSTTFASEEERDASAESRVELWGNCLDLIRKHPLFGIGPENFGNRAPEYGWIEGKEAHNLWLQTGAETGLPGMACFAGFFGFTVVRLWKLARHNSRSAEPWLPAMAAMVVSGLCGFAIGASFVTVTRLEMPYMVTVLGAGVLKVSSVPRSITTDQLTRQAALC